MKQQKQHNQQEAARKTVERIRFDVAVEIPASPEVVFAYLSDLGNNPQWNWAVTATNPLNDRTGLGARYQQERAWPQPGSDILEVTAYGPPALLEVTAEQGDQGQARYRYELTPKGGTSTRLEVRVELKPTNGVGSSRMYTARVEAAIASNIEELRRVLIEARVHAVVAGSR